MSDWKRKLDAYGRLLIEGGDAHEPVDAMVRLKRPLDALKRQALIKAGAVIHTESGTILTVLLARNALRPVAELDFIARVEVSRALSPE